MYLEGLSGWNLPLYAIHKYVADFQKELPMSAIPQSLIDPAFTSSGKPFISTNRYGTGRYSQQVFNEQIADAVTQQLEGTPKLIRGDRRRPSVLKYPLDLGSAQVPHVMQFKVFWRWEAKDLREGMESAKAESQKNIQNLQTLASLIDNGELSPEMLYRSPLSNESIAALEGMVVDPNTLKIVDPNSRDSIATLLQTNPGKAKQILEQTIMSEQTRLSSIESELDGGAGKVGLDEQERLLVQDRLSENVQRTGVGESAIKGAAAGGVFGGLVGMLFGGKGAAIGAAAGAAGGAAVAAGGAAVAKAFSTEAVYDQMVSVYLPFCTKVNNEDSFVYEDSNQALAGAVFDAMGGDVMPAAGQALEAGAQIVGNRFAPGAVQAARGTVINPRLEKLFRQKDFRNFSFSWEFYPRNRDEVQAVRDIIETFRYHAHPAMDNKQGTEEENKVQIVLRTPAEFEIRFLSSNPDINAAGFVENEYLPKIGRCALSTISVDYTPNSLFSTFADNSPTAITLTLNFSEMGLLTRETVDKGF